MRKLSNRKRRGAQGRSFALFLALTLLLMAGPHNLASATIASRSATVDARLEFTSASDCEGKLNALADLGALLSVAKSKNDIVPYCKALFPYTDPTEAAISEFYRTILYREPDAAGLAYWVDQVKNHGKTLEDVSANFYWCRALPVGDPNRCNSGYSAPPTGTDTKTDTTTDSSCPIASDPIAQQIMPIYTSVLKRAYDCDGLTYWVEQVKSGAYDVPKVWLNFQWCHNEVPVGDSKHCD